MSNSTPQTLQWIFTHYEIWPIYLLLCLKTQLENVVFGLNNLWENNKLTTVYGNPSVWVFHSFWYRSSCPEVFCEKGEKHRSQYLQENPCIWSLFLIKFHRYFCKYYAIFKNSFFIQHLRWLLILVVLLLLFKPFYGNVPIYHYLTQCSKILQQRGI